MAMEDQEVEQVDPIYIKALGKERNLLMQSLGMPGADTIPRHVKYDVVDYLVSMEPNVPNVRNKPISTTKQMESLKKILRNPLKHPYLIGIGSFPSDSRAKHLAQTIMSAGIDAYEADRKAYGARSRPLWHRVYGNYKDSLRDGSKESPSMLIISNLNDESSSVKMEKVRDLLEMYSDIPRIVVSGGGPIIDMFSFRLSLPMNAAFYVGPNNLIREET